MIMKYFFILFSIISISLTQLSPSQSITDRYKSFGEMYITQFSSAPFPHPKRLNGHIYNNQSFSAEEHYSDSSVAIFIPKGFKPTEPINFVVYFHGWNNNIDSACAEYKLIEQFSESKKNAIFVFPEGPKNAPDSFGGKLEEKNGLKNLLNDVLKFLTNKEKIKTENIGNIILAGHSGAYHVISNCLMHGGLTRQISEVILFDALYGQTEKFLHWITNFNGRFIDIYTDYGGTKEETEHLMKILDTGKILYFKTEESKLEINDLKNNRLIFIHTDLNHNEVIAKRNQFMNYLKATNLTSIN
jgi:hypothetical protein